MKTTNVVTDYKEVVSSAKRTVESIFMQAELKKQ